MLGVLRAAVVRRQADVEHVALADDVVLALHVDQAFVLRVWGASIAIVGVISEFFASP